MGAICANLFDNFVGSVRIVLMNPQLEHLQKRINDGEKDFPAHMREQLEELGYRVYRPIDNPILNKRGSPEKAIRIRPK